MTEVSADKEEQPKLFLLKKLFLDVFSSPVDAYDFYANTERIKTLHLLGFHFLFWVYAPLGKLLSNLILIQFLKEGEEGKIHLPDGVMFSFGIYPGLFILGFVLERFRMGYKEANNLPGSNISGLGIISFLPFSSTTLFWIFPKPWNFLFLVLGISYSFKIYYSSLLSFDNFSRQDFIRLILYYLILLGILSSILIFIGNIIRGN